jgi:hypothetical protein
VRFQDRCAHRLKILSQGLSLLNCVDHETLDHKTAIEIIRLATECGKIALNAHKDPEFARIELQLQTKTLVFSDRLVMERDSNLLRDVLARETEATQATIRSKSPSLGESFCKIPTRLPKCSTIAVSKDHIRSKFVLQHGQYGDIISSEGSNACTNKETPSSADSNKDNEIIMLLQRQRQLEGTIEGLVLRLETTQTENRRLKFLIQKHIKQ